MLCGPVPNDDFHLKYNEHLLKDKNYLNDFLKGNHRNQTLDELQNGEDKKTWLYRIASPAACAVKLNLDAERLTDAFNCYFNSNGVKEALWSWLCHNNFQDKHKWEEGILRYCAEGNLYAVMEEWLVCIKENNPDKQTEYISDCIKSPTSGCRESPRYAEAVQRLGFVPAAVPLTK